MAMWIVTLNTRIQTGAPGTDNYLFAKVARADWHDCDEANVFPAKCLLEGSDS